MSIAVRSRILAPTVLACVLIGTAAHPVAAEPAAAASGSTDASKQPSLTPPVLQQFVEADYPPEGVKEGLEANVVLQLDIDPMGKVFNVVVTEPAGHGFDEAATEAAKKFVFEPAKRHTTPIPSRILYRYAFTLKTKAPAPSPETGNPESSAQSLLHGVVTIGDTTEPMVGARVSVKGVTTSSLTEQTTGADGAWSMRDLPPGKYTVTVSATGYEPLTVEEEIAQGEATEVTYRLSPKAEGYEVVVRGERPPREVTRRTLQRREMERIPGTNGDALRSLQNLPGVARPPGFAGLLIVRGSAPQDTQVFVDGTLVPLVYHFGGLTSVIPTELLEKIDFYPGNFSSQYGRVQGGIVDVGIRSSNSDGKYHGLVQADFIDARGLAEGPIPGLPKWSFVAGARRSYVDLWLKPVLKQAGSNVVSSPVYYDYQLFVETHPNAHSLFRAGFFGSDDRLEVLITDPNTADPGLSGDLGFHTAFWRLQAMYRNDFTDRLRFSTVTAFGYETINFFLGSLYFKLDSHPLSHRSEISYTFGRGVTLNVGQDIILPFYDVNLRVPPPPRPGEPSSGPFATKQPNTAHESGSLYQPAAFAEFELVPNDRLRIVPGLRVDYNKAVRKWDVSPRANARYDLVHGFPRTTIKGGLGVFDQPPTAQESSRTFGSPLLSSNRALHYSLGGEQEITRQVEVSLEGFYKQLDNQVSRAPSANGAFQYANLGSGYVVGSELLLRYKPDARFFGWLAYTLSRSTRRDSPEAPQALFQYDQTHILTVLGSYQLGHGWEFGARFRLVSGNLTTPCQGGFFNSAAGAYACISGAPFSERLPMFHQLDLRLDKHWNYQTWRLSAYLDVQNVYNRSNPDSLSYNYNYTQSTYSSFLPIIPSIGVRGEF